MTAVLTSRPIERTARSGRRTAALVGVLLAATVAVTVSGCTGPPSVIGEEYDGAGPGTLGPEGTGNTDPTVGWVETGRSFFVMTYGSSSCPDAPTGLSVDGDTLSVTMTSQGGDVCTADFGPASYSVDLPAELRTQDSIAVRLLFENGDTTEHQLER